jgi:hypothetical protein
LPAGGPAADAAPGPRPPSRKPALSMEIHES